MKQIFSILLLLKATFTFAQDSPGFKLWYNKPAGDVWENALPVGNGFQGAMVYGNVDTETIQLNEYTVWSGSPNRNDNDLCLDSLAEIRQLIFDGKRKDAEKLANKTIISKKSQGQMFEPVGSLLLAFNESEKSTNYYRELDISKAVQKTTYTVGNVNYTREVIASFPDRIIVMHLTASKPKSISFTAFYSTPQPKATAKALSNELTISGTTIDHETVEGKIKFKGIAKFKLNGGSISSTDTSFIIKDANEVTIYISIATNFNNYNDICGDENARANLYLSKAFKKSFQQILPVHIAAYQKYFNRVKLDLGTTVAAKLPTDERLKNFDA
ncbi:MAG TPA: glycoside hydrolase family 95 protein, partial [Ginsengibacter sp.]